MNLQELRQQLEAAGCNPDSYAIGTRGNASDAYCLTYNGRQWQVYYTERGHDDAPFYVADDEAQACEFFLRYILALRHDHCVGIFRSREAADALATRLTDLGVVPQQDRIPYGGWADPRYRVFVTGKDIFIARDALGTLPLYD